MSLIKGSVSTWKEAKTVSKDPVEIYTVKVTLLSAEKQNCFRECSINQHERSKAVRSSTVEIKEDSAAFFKITCDCLVHVPSILSIVGESWACTHPHSVSIHIQFAVSPFSPDIDSQSLSVLLSLSLEGDTSIHLTLFC